MGLRRRSLRKGLIAVGCLVGSPGSPAAAIGVVLISMGAVLHFISKGYLEQNRRLTTAGPYRFSRNPFYLANALIDLGLVLVIGLLWLGLVYGVLFAIAYRDTIAREERHLLALFPDEMPAYRATVPALFPTGRSWPQARATGRFSLANPALAEGREYARLLGIALAPGVLWAAATIRTEGWGLLGSDRATALAWILLLPVGWIVKLGLAEALRRPETRLLPFADRPAVRAGIGALFVMLVAFTGPSRWAPIAGPAAAGLVAWASIVTRVPGIKLAAASFGLALLAALAFTGSAPWLFGLPLGWVVLERLDELGEARKRRGDEGAPRRWKYLPAIGAATCATIGLVSLATAIGGSVEAGGTMGPLPPVAAERAAREGEN